MSCDAMNMPVLADNSLTRIIHTTRSGGIEKGSQV